MPKQDIQSIKAIVFEAEKNNRNYIIAYSYKSGWWRLGGTSALYYYYVLAPKIGHTTAKKTVDTDYYSKWPGGVVSFNGLQTLRDKLKKANVIEDHKENDKLIYFKLSHPITEDTIKHLHELDAAAFNEANQLLVPRLAYPNFYAELRELAKTITETVRKLNPVDREIFGLSVAQYAERTKIDFILYVNGYLDAKTFFVGATKHLRYCQAWLKAVQDYELFDPVRTVRIARQIINLLDQLEKIQQNVK